MTDDVSIRRAARHDLPAIVALARRALGWSDTDTAFLEWKHFENPFGVSPMWVAVAGDRIVGFRTFLRWEFVTPAGEVLRAARAVDTATDPSFQGRGIFTRLTLDAVASLPDEGVELIFNTPNGKSLPGYLKMGWREVGRLALSVMPTSWRFPAVVATARQAAGRWPLPTTRGESPLEVFAQDGLDDLLAAQPSGRALRTRRTRQFLLWRYGNEARGYRVALLGDGDLAAGFAVFRRRRRGRAVEGVVCDVLAPHGHEPTIRRLVREVAGMADADYLIRLDRRAVTGDPVVRLPGAGPVLACRPLDATVAPSDPRAWALSMGDVELF